MHLRQRWKSITRTSPATYDKETIITDPGNEPLSAENPLELNDIVVVETNDGEEIEFEVVGIVEDEEGKSYAVCYSSKIDEETPTDDEEGPQPFIVTDAFGQLIRDPAMAQAILDDFLLLAEEEDKAGESDESSKTS